MKKPFLLAVFCAVTLALAGCGRGKDAAMPDVAPPDNDTRLGDSTDLDLAAWLKLPRAELARLGDEWGDNVHQQLEAIRTNPGSVDLLPGLLPPMNLPVLDRARFDKASGISLPPYVEPGKKDAALALHLARHGDLEAALVVAPEEDSLRAKLATLKTARNYPVEWSRLVGLALVSSQLKLALGDVDGATQTVLLHQQLAALLDPQAARGPLGAALLSSGKRALERAATAWREPRRNKVALAADIDAALAAWGPVPPAVPALKFASPVAEVQALFATPPRGKAFIAAQPAAVARVIELLGLPLPVEGVQVVVAFLDDRDSLAEVQLAYRAKIDTLYPTPGHVAYRLAETGFTGGDEVKTANLVRQRYTAEGLSCEIARSNRSLAMGGLVRVTPEKEARLAAATRNLRDFGPIHLDRGFEANRFAVAPREAGSLLLVKDAPALKTMAAVLDTPVPDTLMLQRDGEVDVLVAMEMSFAPGENDHALDRLLPSLWDDYGPGKLEDVEDRAGAHLSFTWQDGTTRVHLRLAYDESGPVFGARDTQGPDRRRARLEEAHRRDAQERQARIEVGSPALRLPRSLGQVNDLQLDGLSLGSTKAEVDAVLPKGRSYRRKEVPGGVSVVFLDTPTPESAYWARQLLVRFDRGTVAEIRVRYKFGPPKAKKGESLMERLADSRAGVPETIPATWTGLWADLPPAEAIVHQRWQDDLTVRTFQQDARGAEVILRERSLEPHPWLFVTRGVPGCQLGDTRQAVEKVLRAPATTSDGASVYRMPTSSPYEMALVWYEGDRVRRLTAVHRDRPKIEAKGVQQALASAWGRDVDGLGYTSRQQGARGKMLGAYYWHDDAVRVRTSVQNTDQGPRVMTEWRYWPVAVTQPVPAPPAPGPVVTRAK